MPDHRKRGFLLENFRLFHLKSKGGAQVEYHYHEFCKILLLISGSGGYCVDGQRYLLQSGDIVLLNAHSRCGSLHSRVILQEEIQRMMNPKL